MSERMLKYYFDYICFAEKDCSFFQLLDLWFPNFVAFESVEKAGYYLRMKNGRLVLQHYDGTREFKEEASFKMESKISMYLMSKYCKCIALILKRSSFFLSGLK